MGWNAYENSGTQATATRCGSSQTTTSGERVSISGWRGSANADELLAPASVAEGGQQLLCAARIDTDFGAIFAEKIVDARQPNQLFVRNLVEPHRPGVEVALGNRLLDDQRHLVMPPVAFDLGVQRLDHR